MTTPSTPTPAGDRIDRNDPESLQQWADHLDATAEQIEEAVDEVGDLASDVELHLKGSRATTNADREARADAE